MKNKKFILVLNQHEWEISEELKEVLHVDTRADVFRQALNGLYFEYLIRGKIKKKK